MTTPVDVLERIEILLNECLKPNRRPHKCPLCDGKGYVSSVENGIASGHRCAACDAKGLVWG